VGEWGGEGGLELYWEGYGFLEGMSNGVVKAGRAEGMEDLGDCGKSML